ARGPSVRMTVCVDTNTRIQIFGRQWRAEFRTGMARRRNYLVGALFVTVAVGLASRKWRWLLPATLGKYPGDALWAGMVYWAVAFDAPSAPVIRVAAYA